MSLSIEFPIINSLIILCRNMFGSLRYPPRYKLKIRRYLGVKRNPDLQEIRLRVFVFVRKHKLHWILM